MTDTRGEGIINSIFEGYAPFKGDIPRRDKGSLVAYETGEATTYGIFNVQDLGVMFVDPQDMVYAGQIVGEALKSDEITVNVCKNKHMTAIRSAGKDEALRLVPPRKMSLEQALEFIADDELVEVTPKSMRLRKKILNHDVRMKLLMRSREK